MCKSASSIRIVIRVVNNENEQKGANFRNLWWVARCQPFRVGAERRAVRGVRGSSSLVVPAPVVIDDERADRLEVVMLVVELHRDAMTEIVWLELGIPD